jgi:hypothetical protein
MTTSRCTSSLPVPPSAAGIRTGLPTGRGRLAITAPCARIRARGFGRLLRTAQFRRRHHLHGLGDLARRLDRRDAVFQVLQAGMGSAAFRVVQFGELRQSSPSRQASSLSNSQLRVGFVLAFFCRGCVEQVACLSRTRPATSARTANLVHHRSCRDSRSHRRRSPQPALRSSAARTAAASAARSGAHHG